MTLRRYVIWVPRGYHIKRQYKHALRRHAPAPETVAEEPVSPPISPEKTNISTDKTIKTDMADQADKTEKRENDDHIPAEHCHHVRFTQSSDVAHFDPDCNPFQCYLNDMASCLTAMPGDSFIHHQDTQEDTRKDARLEKPDDTFHSDKTPSPDENKTRPTTDPAKDRQPDTGAKEETHHTNACHCSDDKDDIKDTDDREEQTVQCSLPESDNHVRTEDLAAYPREPVRPLALDTPEKQGTQKQATPNLRLLTGVPTCLQATHRQ